MTTSFVFEHDYNRILRPEAAQALAGKDGRVLNVACEFNLIPGFLEGLARPEMVYGIEINEEIVRTTPNIRFCNIDTDAMPFEDGFLDLVLSVWGIEHFKTDNLFRESARTLKKGGRIILLTPNILNPLFFFNKVTQGWAAKFYFRHLTDSQYHAHQTHYCFNSPLAIGRAASKHGLTLSKVIYFGPSFFTKYFEFNKFLESAVVAGERLITNPVLGYVKPYLICVVEK